MRHTPAGKLIIFGAKFTPRYGDGVVGAAGVVSELDVGADASVVGSDGCRLARYVTAAVAVAALTLLAADTKTLGKVMKYNSKMQATE